MVMYDSCTSGDTFHLNFFKLVQLLKQSSGIVVRVSGSDIHSKLVHFSNAARFISLTLLGTSKYFNLAQEENNILGKYFIFFESITYSSFEQPANASF